MYLCFELYSVIVRTTCNLFGHCLAQSFNTQMDTIFLGLRDGKCNSYSDANKLSAKTSVMLILCITGYSGFSKIHSLTDLAY